jgi:hypothetical protein
MKKKTKNFNRRAIGAITVSRKMWKALKLMVVNSATFNDVIEFVNTVDDILTEDYLEKDPVVTEDFVDLYIIFMHMEIYDLIRKAFYIYPRKIEDMPNDAHAVAEQAWARICENAKGYVVYSKVGDRIVWFKPDEE